MSLSLAVGALLTSLVSPFGLTVTNPGPVEPAPICWNVKANWKNASTKSCAIVDRNHESKKSKRGHHGHGHHGHHGHEHCKRDAK